MIKVILIIIMLLGILFAGHAFANDETKNMIIALRNSKFNMKFLREKKISHNTGNYSLKGFKPSNSINKIITYLKKKKGKVPIFSVKEDRIRLELGVTGKIGLKYTF